ncbi:MAG: efflux RND transporter periplasmic adaptor subunit [Nevskiaceae bacterium]|jgi:RND family efflux transporter MFP subunit|nr:efflux RND transporter periplasmic adaptor subunit [Nevskiaceae bacterium]
MRVLAIAGICAALIAGCERPPQVAPSAPPPGVAEVVVVPVESAVLSTSVALPGQFLPFESADLYPKVQAFVESIAVDRGSHVRAGDVLVRLSAPEITAQQAQAAANYRAASATLVSDRATYERLASAAAKTPGIIADNDLEVARQLAAASAAAAEAADEALRSAREMTGYLTIRAPFDGVITARNLHPGAIAGVSGASGLPILQLAKIDKLRLTVAVPASDIQGAAVGQTISFTTPSAPGKTFNAPITRMAQAVDPRTRTMMVEADVPGSAELTAGSFASVNWPITRSYPTLRVPPGTIANDQQRQFVIVVEGDIAKWVDVTTGLNDKGLVEVFGELKAGDLIVEHGTDAIRDGTTVKAARKP